MAENTLQKLVRKAYEATVNGSGESRLAQTASHVEGQLVLRHTRLPLMVVGLGLGFLAVPFGFSWVRNSPLFNVVGTVACFLFFVVCWVAGGLWWIVTGGTEVFKWVDQFWPVCVQPYRSAAGLAVCCVIIMTVGIRFLSVRVLLKSNLGQEILSWTCRILWLLAIAVLLCAFFFILTGNLKHSEVPKKTDKVNYRITGGESQKRWAISGDHIDEDKGLEKTTVTPKMAVRSVTGKRYKMVQHKDLHPVEYGRYRDAREYGYYAGSHIPRDEKWWSDYERVEVSGRPGAGIRWEQDGAIICKLRDRHYKLDDSGNLFFLIGFLWRPLKGDYKYLRKRIFSAPVLLSERKNNELACAYSS